MTYKYEVVCSHVENWSQHCGFCECWNQVEPKRGEERKRRQNVVKTALKARSEASRQINIFLIAWHEASLRVFSFASLKIHIG